MTAGDTAPDLTLFRPDGSPVTLASFLQTDFLLVVFLRHLV